MGHPSVAGSTMRRRSSISVGSRLDKARRPPPLRRTRPFGSGAASRSFRPRPMVERARPVISETASSPPHPAARTSPAANTRRPRSSSFEPTASQRLRIAWQSIMPIRISKLERATARRNQMRQKKPPSGLGGGFCGWLRGQDLNLRPSGYEPDELPGCSTPRHSEDGSQTTEDRRLFSTVCFFYEEEGRGRRRRPVVRPPVVRYPFLAGLAATYSPVS